MPLVVSMASICFLKAPPSGGITQISSSNAARDTCFFDASGWSGRKTITVLALKSFTFLKGGRAPAVPGALMTTSSSLLLSKSSNSWSMPSTTSMVTQGLPEETRLYAHGQGCEMVERPLIRQDETMPLAEGMLFAVHPGYDDGEVFAVICDNYMVEADGMSACLHQTEKQIFEIG